MQNDDYHFKFKVVVLGDKAVGKTAFLDCKKFFNLSNKSILWENSIFGTFRGDEHQISGIYRIVDNVSDKLLGDSQQNTEFLIHIPIFVGMHSSSIHVRWYKVNKIVTKRQSFQNVEKWIQLNEKANPPIKILVGNKVDLYSTTKNTVSKADAIGLAKKYGMEYFETCSIGDSSITPIFDYLFTTITGSIPNPPTPQSLVGKGILLGKKLINSPKYHLALCEIATLYE